MEIGFSAFLADFRGARLFLTSKSSSSRFFALDGQIFRSVRRLELIIGFITVRTSTCGEIYEEGPPAPARQQRTNVAAVPPNREEVANLATFVRAVEPVGKRPQKRRVGRTRTEALHALRPEASADFVRVRISCPYELRTCMIPVRI